MDVVLVSAVQSVMPTSVFKALLCVGLLLAWARWAAIVDKDAMYFNLPRRLWNAVHVGTVALGFLLIFFFPIFLVGYLICFFGIVGVATAYTVLRNKEVPANAQWRLDKEFFREALTARRQERATKDASLRFSTARRSPWSGTSSMRSMLGAAEGRIAEERSARNRGDPPGRGGQQSSKRVPQPSYAGRPSRSIRRGRIRAGRHSRAPVAPLA